MWTPLQMTQLRPQTFYQIGCALLLSFWMVMLAPPLWAQEFPQPNAVDDRIAIVNLNEDDAITLAALLTGIGETRALAIVAYREQHGLFASIDDLGQVPGIGPATIAANRDRIILRAADVTP